MVLALEVGEPQAECGLCLGLLLCCVHGGIVSSSALCDCCSSHLHFSYRNSAAAGNLKVPTQYKNVIQIEIGNVIIDRYCKYTFPSLSLTDADVWRDPGGHS